MFRPGRPAGVGRLGLQLALAFIGVALAAVATALLVASLAVSRDVQSLVRDQELDLARAVAAAAATAYRQSGWTHPGLAPIVAAVVDTRSGVEIHSDTGRLVAASPRFATFAVGAPKVSREVLVQGRAVGRVTVAFGHGSLGQEINEFSFERWPGRFTAAGIAALIALLVAWPLSRLITAPVERMIWAARARRDGYTRVRVGQVRGLGELSALAHAFDEMADSKDEQDQLRRNLVADVAHELRTPIAVLQAGHEAMLDGLTAPTTEQLTSLRDEVVRLTRMVDDLQRLASAEAAALQLTLVRRDLAAVAATAATSLVESFEASNVTLVERLARVEVLCDPLRMHEVIVNLLTNALKFTPAEGQVTLETRLDGDSGELRVTDTGVGIPPDELPHIAERFFRGQRSAEVAGSGIGLTIVDELVRAHRGTLEFASQPGQGTTVTVRLPLSRSANSARRYHAGIIGGDAGEL
ncbi:MAG TPA: HAMP domain-containing sensor histidine kinase [Streptosporangiaceae bacterium]|nr:HAMP domain-containing sensor histidine kinase [Streptosporangiaceae bacterium]